MEESEASGSVPPPITGSGPAPAVPSDAMDAAIEATAILATLKQQERDRGVRGKAKRGLSWLILVIIGLTVIGGVSDLFSGGASSPTSGWAANPCNQAAVLLGKETVGEYKNACPNWQQYNAAPRYPKTVPATAVVGGAAILGGTQAAWNAAYTPDPNVQGGGAYDPSPGSYPDNTDRFTGVNYDNGRVLDLTEELPADTDIAKALVALKQMLPSDAKLGRIVVLDNCAVLGITGATLKSEFGSPNAEAFFDSGLAGAYYAPKNVGEFELSADETLMPSC